MLKIDSHKIFSQCFNSELQAVARELSVKLAEGNICINLREAQNQQYLTADLLCSPQLLKPENGGYLYPDQLQPFTLYKDNVYITRYFRYETTILNKIKNLVDTGKADYEKRKEDLREKHKEQILNLFTKNGETNIYALISVLSAYLNNFSILTGGPGTGKTTTVAKLLSVLFQINPNLRVAIAAPTGKASARLNDSMKGTKDKIDADTYHKIENLKATTIHRLMGGYKKFHHNAEKQLDYDLFIIDECSMIDAALMAQFMAAVPDSARLIMLGDRNQLSSVEAGSIFGDLCQVRGDAINQFSESYTHFINDFLKPGEQLENHTTETHILTDCITELIHSHRFKPDEGIGKFSSKVIKGEYDMLDDFRKPRPDNEEQDFVRVLKPEDMQLDNPKGFFFELINTYKEYIKVKDEYIDEKDDKIEKEITKALKLLNSRIKVLCALRDGKYGIHNINRIIESHLELNKGSKTFYEYQPILITANNKELGIYNGDIGIIRKNDQEQKMAWFSIDDNPKPKPIPLIYITEYETAFAMTIHKSQGSQYEKVLVVLPPKTENKLLSRELLYTAVTRASKECYIFAPDETLINTIKTRVKRVSGITDRLKEVKN